MKLVNLLPEWYLQRQRERQTLRRQVLWLVALAAIMAGWQGSARVRLYALGKQRAAVVDVRNLVGDLKVKVMAEEAQVQRLENLQLAYRDVGNTVPMSAVLQQVRNNMTPGMALSRQHRRAQRAEQGRRPGRRGGEAGNSPKMHDVARFTVVGVAPNDVLIAQLIGRLSANQLFTDIALNYTRTDIVRDFDVRRFEIQMTIDLDRLASEQVAPRAEAVAREDAHGD